MKDIKMLKKGIKTLVFREVFKFKSYTSIGKLQPFSVKILPSEKS